MKTAFLLLGSNLGDRINQLSDATVLIRERVGEIKNYSSVYETSAWGIKNQPDFLNAVVEVETKLSPFELLDTILQIEQQLGRNRKIKWGPREIDIDILFYENEIVREEELVIPHPGIPDRKFTLIPLVELIPNYSHPGLNKSMTQLLEETEDDSEVKLYENLYSPDTSAGR